MNEPKQDITAAKIEVAVRAAQTARSVLDLLSVHDHTSARLHWRLIGEELQALRRALGEAWPDDGGVL